MEEMKTVIEDYARKPVFASFLPGIAGLKGIPVWCLYVNRGQGIASFGTEDKDHSIMEFSPAHQAWQNVKRTGFRTFIRSGGAFLEPFQSECAGQRMTVSMNGLTVSEHNTEWGLDTQAEYYILPGEPIGALVRRLTVTNTGTQEQELELLDGMPAVVPYGVNQWTMKNMLQTGKAWMKAEILENLPYYRVRASMEDTADVGRVEAGNFSLAVDGEGKRLLPVVDTELVFDYDTSLEQPVGFLKKGLEGLMSAVQNCENQVPCSFYGTKARLLPGKSVMICQMIGRAESREVLGRFAGKKFGPQYFTEKKKEANVLVWRMTDRVETHTGNPVFDAYCRYTYMDNALRGGYPMPIDGDRVFYAYSRKHGDLERDYNYFSMRPEFYSQGNGNFRDVNQNRRCDVSLSPFVGTANIRIFYELLQLDGYNPLQLEPVSWRLEKERCGALEKQLKSGESPLLPFLMTDFTPGQLYGRMEELGISEKRQDELFSAVMKESWEHHPASFNEGYWSDHWTYNLDLVEDYLSIYPEQEEALLFETSYTWYAAKACIQERRKRYVKTAGGIRQYGTLTKRTVRRQEETGMSDGRLLCSALIEKMILLCGLKYAALDFYGMGIEMEGGKPGWYDALNGLPGLLGSSMAETVELERLMDYVLRCLHAYDRTVMLPEELNHLLSELARITEEEMASLSREGAQMSFWNRINDAKERYRRSVYAGPAGVGRPMRTAEAARLIDTCRRAVRIGIEKARAGRPVIPTYFYYEVTDYEEDEAGILPLAVTQKEIPLFLEGPVHLLKLPYSLKEKAGIARAVKESCLYDRRLSMYKVNGPLQEATYELGRAAAFTPGWLENESVWLHMEYKYLLELLRSGLYEEFTEAFYRAAVPFLDPETYGRSVLENSSFIASSSNPNARIHGRGFVARLSGSTAEFLHMRKVMLFGEKPFTSENGHLMLTFRPLLPDYLTRGIQEVSVVFLDTVRVVYEVQGGKAYVPGHYRVHVSRLLYADGRTEEISGARIEGKQAEAVRAGQVREIRVRLETSTKGVRPSLPA